MFFIHIHRNSSAVFYRCAERFSPLREILKDSPLVFLLSAQKAKKELFSFIYHLNIREQKIAWKPLLKFFRWMKYLLSPKLRNTHPHLPVSPCLKTRKNTFQISSHRCGGGRIFSFFFSVLALPKLTSRKIILCVCNFFAQIYEVWLAWLAFEFWTNCSLCHFPLWISWDVCLVSPWHKNLKIHY